MVRCVPGDAGNVKITFPDDLFLAERLLAKSGFDLSGGLEHRRRPHRPHLLALGEAPMSDEHAELLCETCGMVTDHELHYAGRLLESTRCTRCGRHIELSHRALLPAYARDLEQRVASKPRADAASGPRPTRSATPGSCPGPCCGSRRSSSGSSGAWSAGDLRVQLVDALEQVDRGRVVDPPGQRRGGHQLDRPRARSHATSATTSDRGLLVTDRGRGGRRTGVVIAASPSGRWCPGWRRRPRS